MLSKSAKKVLDAANDAYTNVKECDEERAYVLYMKFIYVFESIKKTKDYKDDKTYYNSMVSMDKFGKFYLRGGGQIKNIALTYYFVIIPSFLYSLQKILNAHSNIQKLLVPALKNGIKIY